MKSVTSKEIEVYKAQVEILAKSFRVQSFIQDELVQEGLIQIWKCLSESKTPSMDLLKLRMIEILRRE